jgi:hypothetical protein
MPMPDILKLAVRDFDGNGKFQTSNGIAVPDLHKASALG